MPMPMPMLIILIMMHGEENAGSWTMPLPMPMLMILGMRMMYDEGNTESLSCCENSSRQDSAAMLQGVSSRMGMQDSSNPHESPGSHSPGELSGKS